MRVCMMKAPHPAYQQTGALFLHRALLLVALGLGLCAVRADGWSVAKNCNVDEKVENIAFLLDTSRSVLTLEFNQTLSFVNRLVAQVSSSEGARPRVGVIKYAKKAHIELSYSDSEGASVADLQHTIRNIHHNEGIGTYPARALHLMRTSLNTKPRGFKGSTASVVLFSDGIKLRGNLSEEIAALPLDWDLHIIAVGTHVKLSTLHAVRPYYAAFLWPTLVCISNPHVLCYAEVSVPVPGCALPCTCRKIVQMVFIQAAEVMCHTGLQVANSSGMPNASDHVYNAHNFSFLDSQLFVEASVRCTCFPRR